MQVLYIDILFILNLVMDFFIFASTAIFLNQSINKRRIVCGSILAALLYCLGIIIPILRTLPFYLYYLCIPVMPICIIFKPNSIKNFLKMLLLSHFSAFLIGGAVFNSYYMLLTFGVTQSVSIGLPLILGGMIYTVIYLGSSFIRQRFIMPHFEYDLLLSKDGTRISIRGFLDSGNALYTICSHKPVTIVPYETIDPLLTKAEREVVRSCLDKGIMQTLNEVHNEIAKLYLIPYESIGCKEDMLLGIVIDKMTLSKGTYYQSFNKCVIGVAAKEVFKGQDYDALIHPDYLLRS